MDTYDTWLCIVGRPCSAQQIAAFIGAFASVAAVTASAIVALIVRRSEDRRHAADHGHSMALELQRQRAALELESAKRELDLRIKARECQLHRLRELQRSAENTFSRAKAVSHFQNSRDIRNANREEFEEGFVESSGHFLREAAGIFAPPETGAPNLPAMSEVPLQELRRAVVFVTLLLSLDLRGEPSSSGNPTERMGHALERLEKAVGQFKAMVALEEDTRLIQRVST